MQSHDKININSIEFFIKKSVEDKRYFETICLTQNVIELYMKYKLKKYSNDVGKIAEKEWKIIRLNELRFVLKIVDRRIYDLVNDFNNRRNKIFHELLKNKISISYGDILETAKNGRKAQLYLSPIHDIVRGDNISDYVEKTVLQEFK